MTTNLNNPPQLTPHSWPSSKRCRQNVAVKLKGQPGCRTCAHPDNQRFGNEPEIRATQHVVEGGDARSRLCVDLGRTSPTERRVTMPQKVVAHVNLASRAWTMPTPVTTCSSQARTFPRHFYIACHLLFFGNASSLAFSRALAFSTCSLALFSCGASS